ncbi:hypothetical protein M3P05_12430 [Sansalvadorimonas sp. 2012CJ34-2]|uniref:Type II secretion system protein GspC N-terminal domain-containing protein n=1 Tax=Parendozoicomonas callyspongiae TaxID=2942213 RepID=A0ABT0PI90_9GAMM|nr:type II secretion system protein N [Sansalvadorimonas sp. 2012CJ34-2]MCL6270731.1 hypothetical protein [Sansalvadorimonas sp. 2012CJ34-2]
MDETRSHQLNKQAANCTAFVLVLLLCWQVKGLGESLWDHWYGEPSAGWKPIKIASEQKQKRVDPYQALNGFEMFGTFQPELNTVAESLPDTKLPLALQAIFYSADSQRSTAMVDTGSKAVMVQAGEEIQPGVTLYEVRKNGITLYRKGQYERLELDQIVMEGIEVEKRAKKTSDFMSADMLAIKQRLEEKRMSFVSTKQ